MKLTKIEIATNHEGAELASYCLMECGAEAVEIVDKKDYEELLTGTKFWDYIDENASKVYESGVKVSTTLKAASVVKINKILQFLQGYGFFDVKITEIKNEDWYKIAKKFYKPIYIKNIIINPTDKKMKQEKGKIIINIQPSMAFGTGSHETTSMCLQLMQEIDLKNKTVLDVGCGSGILGIGALKLNAKKCIFIDNDEKAVANTKENVKINKVASRAEVLNGNLADEIDEEFDVVFANITADVLCCLAKDIASKIKKGSYIILSGIIEGRLEEVKKAYKSIGKIEKQVINGDWSALLILC